MNKTIIAALFAAIALPVAAQTATPRSDAGPAKVEKMEAKAKSDGQVTARERKKVAKAQNKQSKKIAKQKHDKQKKAPAS